jgi:mRNA interferase RelE/StbE
MARVRLTSEARAAFDALRPPIRGRVGALIERLANWPAVSGAKPLRGEMAGSYRVRTGDYRVVFQVRMDVVAVTRIALRRDVYEE